MKPEAKKSFDGMSNHHGAKYDLLNEVYGDQYTRGKDYEFKTFMIHVVKPFALPKTGGCGWNASLCVVSAMLSSLIAAVFVMDQTKRGHELLGRWRLV